MIEEACLSALSRFPTATEKEQMLKTLDTVASWPLDGYLITCQSVVKDAEGNVVELHCTYDPATRGGNTPDGRKVKSTIHWVSAAHAVDAEVRLYDNLFTKENPDDVEDLL